MDLTKVGGANMIEQRECEMTQTIQLLSKRWTLFLLEQLQTGPQRFSKIGCQLSISGRLLSERLKELEAAGLVERMIYPETPVRIEYALTEKGRAFKPVLDEIRKWAEQWAKPEMERCREELKLHDCGQSGPDEA